MTGTSGIRALRVCAFMARHLVQLALRRVRGVPKRVTVTQAEIRAEPHAVWNAFIDLIATSFQHELTPRQRLAQLVFRYDSEVQNGGHLQFFCNSAGEHADETVGALDALSAGCQARVLDQAMQQWSSIPRAPISSLAAYSKVAARHEFAQFDRAFCDCSLSLPEVLARHLSEHETEYIIRK